MKKYSFQYSIPEMTRRLFALARPIRKYLTISTLASIFGNLGHMGLMGFGAMWILISAGAAQGSATLYALLAIRPGPLSGGRLFPHRRLRCSGQSPDPSF